MNRFVVVLPGFVREESGYFCCALWLARCECDDKMGQYVSSARRGYWLKGLDVRAAERKRRYARVEDQREEVKLRLKCQVMME
jgi:hypothetical protein